MKEIIFLLFLVIGNRSFGQRFSYPIFNQSEKSIIDFIPVNWFLKDSAAGDLNGDSISDLVLVVESKDTIEELRPDSSINRASPRILLVLLKNKNSGSYDLVLQNNTFIIRCGESGMDPRAFGKLSISKKILSIEFEFIRGFSIYKFRYQQQDFYLIGAISNGVAGGEYTGFDIIFITKKAKQTTGDVAGEHTKIKWYNLSSDHLIKLKEFKMLFTIEVLPGQFL
jgi:hypothetical protein